MNKKWIHSPKKIRRKLRIRAIILNICKTCKRFYNRNIHVKNPQKKLGKRITNQQRYWWWCNYGFSSPSSSSRRWFLCWVPTAAWCPWGEHGSDTAAGTFLGAYEVPGTCCSAPSHMEERRSVSPVEGGVHRWEARGGWRRRGSRWVDELSGNMGGGWGGGRLRRRCGMETFSEFSEICEWDFGRGGNGEVCVWGRGLVGFL